MNTYKIDITGHAVAAGWTLPAGWQVLAWTEPEDDLGEPRDYGDAYATDVDETDYANPVRGFCKHCENWIIKLDAAQADALNREDGGGDVVAGDWASTVTGNIERLDIACPEWGTHELGEPMAVRWWRADSWSFVAVFLQVTDSDGIEWGAASLGGTESGSFPMVDPRSGEVTAKELDPLTDPDYLTELIGQALGAACDTLEQARREQRWTRRLRAWLRAVPSWRVATLPVITAPLPAQARGGADRG